jgi:EmrB/QacA subfamily drug resistance transporter
MTVTEAPSPRPAHASASAVLAAVVMTVAALMDMLDVTVVNVALPTIRTRLHAGPTAVEWVVSGYMLAFAALLITAGRLGDQFGRRRLFLIGVAGFGATSLLSGLSQTPTELIVCRLLQGASAAVLMPQILAMLRTVFSGAQRATAFGIYGAVSGLAAAVGVILGGVLTQANLFGLSWRAVFLINVPISVIVLVLAVAWVPETREPSSRRLDTRAAVMLAGALVAIVYPLLEGREHGWPWWCFAVIAGGVLTLCVLGVLERRSRRNARAPLIQIEQFAIPVFSAGVLVQLFFSLGLQGFSLTLILWLQAGHHFSPLHAGLTLLAFTAGAIVTAPNAGQLALRHGRKVLICGALLMAIGTAGTAAPAWIDHRHITTWLLAPGLVIAGAGLGLLVVPLINVVLAAVPAETSGGSSGVFSTAQQLGGAIGIAAIGSVFFAHVASDHFNTAFRAAAPCTVAAYLACAGLACLLPNKAVTDDDLIAATWTEVENLRTTVVPHTKGPTTNNQQPRQFTTQAIPGSSSSRPGATLATRITPRRRCAERPRTSWRAPG